MKRKQVEKDHYYFSRYMSKRRWASVWHQLDEVIRFNPTSILEIGPGPGVFKQVATLFGFDVETFDIDPDLNPDHIGSATALPFAEDTYDVICAFQMLEHLPYEIAMQAFSEMVRVSRRYVIISLPDAKRVWRLLFHIPILGLRTLHIPKIRFKKKKNEFKGEHYWEINKQGYPLKRIIKDLCGECMLIKTYTVFENPYHRFFILEKREVASEI